MVIVITSGHTPTMDSVTGAGLKAKLSHYLREVREGRSFTVLSRDIPFATVGPYDSLGTDDLEITGGGRSIWAWDSCTAPACAAEALSTARAQ